MTRKNRYFKCRTKELSRHQRLTLEQDALARYWAERRATKRMIHGAPIR